MVASQPGQAKMPVPLSNILMVTNNSKDSDDTDPTVVQLENVVQPPPIVYMVCTCLGFLVGSWFRTPVWPMPGGFCLCYPIVPSRGFE